MKVSYAKYFHVCIFYKIEARTERVSANLRTGFTSLAFLRLCLPLNLYIHLYIHIVYTFIHYIIYTYLYTYIEHFTFYETSSNVLLE